MPLDRTLESERSRIVRLCAQITRHDEIAEDLAQEALFEAWQSYDSLRDPAARSAWLSGIARNVCKRWARQRGREAAWIDDRCDDAGYAGSDPLDLKEDPFDLELQLDRQELATLLDRALDLLPPVTRSVLIQQYVEERPQAEIAERLALSRGAVAMRIQRGKLLLRQTLFEEFPEDAQAFGLLRGDREWVETRMWCRLCGANRLYGSLNPEQGSFLLRCPACHPGFGISEAESGPQHRLPALRPADGFQTAYDRLARFCDAYLGRALSRSRVECLKCGNPASVFRSLPERLRSRQRENYGLHVQCSGCGLVVYSSLSGLILGSPEGRQFRRDHRRTRTLPEREIEFDGRPAIVSRFESVTSGDVLVGISDAETLRPLQFHRSAR